MHHGPKNSKGKSQQVELVSETGLLDSTDYSLLDEPLSGSVSAPNDEGQLRSSVSGSVAEVQFGTASENQNQSNRTAKFGSVRFWFCWFWDLFGSRFWVLAVQPEPVRTRFEPNFFVDNFFMKTL